MINIGLIGAGMIAGIHAEAIKKSGTGKLKTVFGPEGTGEALAAQWDAKAVANVDELIGDPGIQAVVIASPTPTHPEYLKKCADAGKHVLCEKPVARNESDLAPLPGLFSDNKRVISIGHVLRYTSEYLELLDTVEKGTLGKIGTIRLGRASCMPKGAWAADYYQSGGTILDLMIHDLYALQWIFGPVERVFCMSTATEKSLANDYSLAVVRMASGAIAHLEASWVEAPGTFYYYFEVAGSKGLFEFDSRHQPSMVRYDRAEANARPVTANPGNVSPYDVQMKDFLQAITEGRQTLVPLEVGISATRLALATLESARTGQPVAL